MVSPRIKRMLEIHLARASVADCRLDRLRFAALSDRLNDLDIGEHLKILGGEDRDRIDKELSNAAQRLKALLAGEASVNDPRSAGIPNSETVGED